jgi:hypothetical protein
MMSSFASVFVANANATPENVVPYQERSVSARNMRYIVSYEINAHDQLSLASATTFHLRCWSTNRRVLLCHVLNARLGGHLLMSICAAIPWRLRRSQLRCATYVRACSGVDRRRMMSHLALGGGHRRLWPTLHRVVLIAGRATWSTRLLAIHSLGRQAGLRSVLRCRRRGTGGGGRTVW